jgi:hypothetical protein
LSRKSSTAPLGFKPLQRHLAGFAISFAVPTFAQLKEVVDPEIRQQIEAGPLNIGRNALSFGSDSFQFLPAAVKLRNIFSGSSELRIKHLPMLAALGVEIRVGKLRFETDDIFLRSQDLVFDRF